MPLHPSDLWPKRLYSRTWLLEQGMHPRHIASAAMTRVLPGYFTRTDEPADLLAAARLVQRKVRPGAVISHETAAELIGFPLPRSLTRAGGAPIHCSVSKGSGRAGALMTVHVRSGVQTYRHRGVVMSHPVIALQEIAGRLTHEDLVACLDALAADQNGTRHRMELSRIRVSVGRLSGSGAAALRRAAVDARERVWSPMETRMRLMVLSHGYPEPELNHEIHEAEARRRYFIDLAYPQWKIAIEYDGEQHRTNKAQWERDLHKNEVLHAQGWTVLRVSIADLRDARSFILRLDAAITSRNAEASAGTTGTRPPAPDDQRLTTGA